MLSIERIHQVREFASLTESREKVVFLESSW